MNNQIVYDNHFDANEITILLSLGIGLFLVYILPSRFPRKISILCFMCGVTFGFFFDHTLSVLPVSFYDVNDSSDFEVFDFISYWVYGPVSYLFFYVYDLLNSKYGLTGWVTLCYILCFSLVSTGFEWVTVRAGVFHYQKSYGLDISFLIYLIVNSIWVLFYAVSSWRRSKA